MTFEEFFKKKKIDLTALQNAEPSLFAEFKSHYEQMGEKSFDHTKKYWFNQLRRRFAAPIEVKVEKVHIENPLAEQTVTESLAEPAAPSVGFKPRFKAGMGSKPAADEKPAEATPATEEQPAETTAPAPSVGFKPRFKAAMVAKPVEEKPAETEAPKPATEQPDSETPKPVGFKPRFNAAKMAKPPAEETPAEPETPKEEPVEDKPAEGPVAKPVGFKPRFNAAKMKPKPPGEE